MNTHCKNKKGVVLLITVCCMILVVMLSLTIITIMGQYLAKSSVAVIVFERQAYIENLGYKFADGTFTTQSEIDENYTFTITGNKCVFYTSNGAVLLTVEKNDSNQIILWNYEG